MALTKVTGQVIKNTTDVTVGVLTVTNTLAVGGTVSIGGTLTYEDVTNVDAVGLITARNGIVVGSGITLSKDGDGFFTGVTTATTFVGALTGNVTGNATGLSGAPNISVGTVSGTTGTFTGDVSIADKIVHTGDTNTLIRFPAAGTIRFDTDGNERARFDSGGRLLLKTTTEGHAAADDLTIENTASDMGITLRSSSSHQGAIYFSDGTSGDAEYRGIITYNHANDKLSVYTNASAALHILSNGDIGINASTINRTDAGRNTIQFDYSGSDGSEGLEIRLSNSALNGNAATDNAAITYIGQDLGITNRENGNIKFSNNGSERLRIDSSGRLGIQGAATKGVLDVRASGGSGTMLTAVFGANEGQTGGTLSDNADKGGRVGLYHYDTDEEPFGLFSYGSSNGSNSLNFGGGTGLMNAATNLGFFTAANSTTTTGTKRMDISSSGDVTINTGNLIMGTGGKGISFAADGNATGNTSELLHDYEEGSWSASSFNYDYDGNQAQRGHYVKVGRVVHAFFRVKFHNQSTYTGQHLRFTGLPFTAADGNPYDVNVGGVAHGYSHIDFFRIYVAPNSTYAYWYTETGSNFNNSTSLNNKDVRGCIIYTASA